MNPEPDSSMFTYQFYNVLHVFGILLLVSALAGMALHSASGGTRQTVAARGLVMSMHGLGALMILVAGFGLLARLGVMHGAGFPGWVWAKLAIWVVLVGSTFIPYRRPQFALPLLVLIPLLGLAAAFLAIYKPF